MNLPEIEAAIDDLRTALTRMAEGEGDVRLGSEAERFYNEAHAAALWYRSRQGPRSEEQGVAVVTMAESMAVNERRLRETARMTQASVARAMSLKGFRWGRVTVAEVESGKRKLSLEEVLALTTMFSVPVFEILLPTDRACRVRLTDEFSVTIDEVQNAFLWPRSGATGVRKS